MERKNSNAMRFAAVSLAGVLISSQTGWSIVQAGEFPNGTSSGNFGQMPFSNQSSDNQRGERPSGNQGGEMSSFSGIDFSEMFTQRGEISSTEDTATLNGTTTMDTVSQFLELAANYTRLSVEAVYVESGDTVREGDPLYKISSENMEELKTVLEKKIKSAKEAVIQAEIDYEKGVSEAKYTKEAALANGELAQGEHEKTQKELQDTVDSNYKTLEDTQEKITELENDLSNGITTTTERITIPTVTYSFANKITQGSGSGQGTMGNMGGSNFSISGNTSSGNISSSESAGTVSGNASSGNSGGGSSGFSGGISGSGGGNFGGMQEKPTTGADDTDELENQPETSRDIEQGSPEETSESVEESSPEETSESIEESSPEETSESIEESSPEETSGSIEESSPEETSESIEESSPEETSESIEESSSEETSAEEVSFSEKLLAFEIEWDETFAEQQSRIDEARTQLQTLESKQLEMILSITEAVNTLIQKPVYLEHSETFWEESMQGQVLNAIKQVMSQTITMTHQSAAEEAQSLIETIEEVMTEGISTEEESSSVIEESSEEETNPVIEESSEEESSPVIEESSEEETSPVIEESSEEETSSVIEESSGEETSSVIEESNSEEEVQVSSEAEIQTVIKYKVTLQTQNLDFTLLLSSLNDYIKLYEEQCSLEKQLETEEQLMEELELQRQDALLEFAKDMELEMQKQSESIAASYEAKEEQAVSEAIASVEAEMKPSRPGETEEPEIPSMPNETEDSEKPSVPNEMEEPETSSMPDETENPTFPSMPGEEESEITEPSSEVSDNFQQAQSSQMQLGNASMNGSMSFSSNSFSGGTGQTTETYDIEEIVQELRDCLPGLNIMISESEITQKLDTITAQKNYDLTMLEASYAEDIYELTLDSLEASLNSANEELEELLEAQQVYQNMENGIICADRSGTLSSVMLDEEDRLSANCELVSYLDTSEVSISVEVGQEQIAEFAVGDNVSVMINNQLASGTVSQIATSATTGRSVSSVTYTMIITVDNSRGRYTTGLSAVVIAAGSDSEPRGKDAMGSQPDTAAMPENMNWEDVRSWKKDSDEEETKEVDKE